MGKDFWGGGLTNTFAVDPNSGQTDAVNPRLFSQIRNQGALDRSSQSITSAPLAPEMTTGDGGEPQFSTPDNSRPQYQPPNVVRPSFMQAAQMGAMPGGMNAMSPGLNKAGKLATLLTQGLQGAMAGRAAEEQATVQSGGRRSGGAGMAFQAGRMQPYQMAGTEQQLEQQRAQTGLLQAEQQNIDIPGVGPMPAWLAKTMGPAWIRGQAQTGAAQIGATGRENVAQMQAQSQEKIHRYIPVPNVGLFDTQTRQVMPGSEQGITITPEIAADHNLPDQFIGKPMSLQQLAGIQRSEVFGTVPVMGAGGPALVNRKTAQVTPLGLGVPALGTPREIADVNNPGQTIVTTGAQALGQPGVQSASVQVPKKAAAAEVPTGVGNTKVAFSTALQHADLLEKAARALNNGDQNTLNSLKNKFAKEFGSTGPINAQTIANAYSREITAMLSKGHMTDAEIASAGGTTDITRMSLPQTIGVLATYRALAQSKMNVLNQQLQDAVQKSQPSGAGGGGGKEIHYKIVNGALVAQ